MESITREKEMKDRESIGRSLRQTTFGSAKVDTKLDMKIIIE